MIFFVTDSLHPPDNSNAAAAQMNRRNLAASAAARDFSNSTVKIQIIIGVVQGTELHFAIQ
jgi:hypothetical protein